MFTARRAAREVYSEPTLHDRIRALGGAVPCRSRDPEAFFDETFTGIESAKSTCRACLLNTLCLTEALARNESWGVWGGELLRNGAVVRTTGSLTSASPSPSRPAAPRQPVRRAC
ncbi:WhiB family transcriptional regulator [Embleya hyalina]|uniref:WhiB family transcriptional regulator n=1 Tax=Embleya hyalina TaxID=516124 RepID=UPI001FE9897F|nr:WhiB family transcriptional regulator [Embleya hyalina]